MPDFSAPLSAIAPDLTGLNQPGPAFAAGGPMPAPNQPAAPFETMTPAMAAPNVTPTPGINPAVPPAAPAGASAPYAGPHARLLQMVSGLAIGLSNFGKSIGTGGKEGGAEGVIADTSEIQQQKIRQQQAAQSAKNAELQQQLVQGEINTQTGVNHFNLASMSDRLNAEHFRAQEAGQAVTAGQTEADAKAQELFDTRGFMPSGYEADPNTGQVRRTGQGSTPAAGAAPTSTAPATNAPASPNVVAPAGTPNVLPGVTPTPAVPGAPATAGPTTPVQSPYNTRLNMVLDTAGSTLTDAQGKVDALVIAARQVVADPNSTPLQKQRAVIAVQNKAGMSAAAVKTLTEKADLAAKQQTGAQGAIKTEQEQLAQNTYNRTVSRNAAGQPTEDFATWQARSTKSAEVQAQQGDPTALGEMAADGLITIPQVAMSRQLDKPGFQKLLAAADARARANGAPEIVVNGRPTGHYFNATAATQQYQYVQEFNNPNSKSQQSINAGNTFLEHSADLLDTNAKYRRTNNQIANTALNKLEKNFGKAVFTEYVAAIAPVKTEYDNALKAGFVPTAEDQKTVDQMLSLESTPAQVEAAVKVMTHTILRRMDSTNQGYKTHTGVDYPNMITPDARVAAGKMGIDTGTLQSGGSFGGVSQVVNAGNTSTKAPAAPTVVGVISKNGVVTGHRMSDGSVQR